jgi:predicted ATPase
MIPADRIRAAWIFDPNGSGREHERSLGIRPATLTGMDSRPVRRVEANDRARRDVWPATIPAVRQILDDGLDIPAGVTMLLGENGSGKSTIVEAVAVAFGLSPEGGSPYARHTTRRTESDLSDWVRLQRSGLKASRWGFFLRAETMHGFYTYLEENPGGGEPAFHELSHGESFLEILRTRFDSPGLYCLDEPEAALSFTGQLALMGQLHDLARAGAQVLCATHSPLLAALPGATLLEVGPWGLRRTTFDELEVVAHWRSFLDDPQRYLRHVI